MQILRFGVVGTSHWARTVHARALLGVHGATLAGVWGRTPEHAQAVADEMKVRAFSSFDELLANVDAVSIAVAPKVQAELAARAAAAGKSLLLEKPFAANLADAVALEEAIRRAGVPAIVFFMRRFVGEIESHVMRAAGQDWTGARVVVHSDAMSSAGPYSGSVWRQEKGAALWDIGPHVLSILLPVLGPVVRIGAVHDGQRTELTTVHRNGASARASLTLHNEPGKLIREYRFISGAHQLVLPEPAFSHQAAYAQAASDLVQMHRSATRAHRCDAAFGLEVSRLLAAAERSTTEAAP